MRDDIIRQLALQEPFVITTGFDRENLFFQVEHPADKNDFMLDYVKSKNVARYEALIARLGLRK